MTALPELIVVGLALGVLLLDVVNRASTDVLCNLAVLGLLVGLAATIALFGPVAHGVAAGETSGVLLGGRFVVDNVSLWFKIIFLVTTIFTIILSRESFCSVGVAQSQALGKGGEFCVLLLLSLLGMMLLVSSRDLITLYVNLELSTVPLILLSAWSGSSESAEASSEAGLKYVVLGAVSSVLMLFGLSLLYGLAGSMEFESIRVVLTSRPIVWLALAFVGAGIGFKLTLFPFHMWAPDVYHGAPAPVTGFLSVASKSVGVALIVVLLAGVVGAELSQWSGVFAVFAALTMTVGNLAAISQHNIKRFMAYSGISQAGYILLGFLGSPGSGFPEVIYYLLGYLVTNCAAFGVIIHLARKTGSEEIDAYAGLSIRSPFLAAVMMVSLFSLAGIPPLAGFTGKFFLFSLAARQGLYWLVALAAINSTVSLYYYLRIVRQMYIVAAPVEQNAVDVRAISPLVRAALWLALVATVVVGVCPSFYENIRQQMSFGRRGGIEFSGWKGQ